MGQPGKQTKRDIIASPLAAGVAIGGAAVLLAIVWLTRAMLLQALCSVEVVIRIASITVGDMGRLCGQ